MTHILLVEDDPGIVTSLSLYFNKCNITINVVHDGEEAMILFGDSKATFDLIILDINLPKKDGFSICEEIRKVSTVPIIILSARVHEDDKVHALELGADDYISKPFSPRELIARISTILKRLEKRTANDKQKSIVSFGSLILDIGEYILKNSDEIIKTTKTEFLILVYLINHHDHIVDRETLMKEIIGYNHYLYDRTIDTHMKNLRKKIRDTVIIETIRGIGYRIIEK